MLWPFPYRFAGGVNPLLAGGLAPPIGGGGNGGGLNPPGLGAPAGAPEFPDAGAPAPVPASAGDCGPGPCPGDTGPSLPIGFLFGAPSGAGESAFSSGLPDAGGIGTAADLGGTGG